MGNEFLGDRRQALEESFFRNRDEKLRKQLHAREQAKAARQALIDATGIDDELVLNAIVELGIHSETLVALELIPLIEVAWADGTMDDKERKAIIAAADEAQVATGSENHELLENWLKQKPDPQLLTTWKDYVAGLCEQLEDEVKDHLKHELLDGARAVAEAAGGILGMGNKISDVEQAMLDDLAQAFA